jgi:mRNA interferase RelE/StbE
MRYGLEFTSSALRELHALDSQIQARVLPKIVGLQSNPFPSGSKKLQGMPGHFRIRAGDYRIVYRINGDRLVIVIVRVGHRREIYR